MALETIGYLPGTLEEKLGYRIVRQYHRYYTFVNSPGVFDPPGPLSFMTIFSCAIKAIQPPFYSIKRKVHIDDYSIRQISDHKEGTNQINGVLPSGVGQMSRIAFAWWSDAEEIKYFRVYADRIHLTYKHVEAPRVFPFGQNAYHHVFPAQDPHHCLRCRSNIKPGEGLWREDHFICLTCQYQEEAGGLRPGYHLLYKKKKQKS